MKKISYTLLFTILSIFCFAQNSEVMYFDENATEISKIEFDTKLESRNYLEIPGEKRSVKTLVLRKNQGEIINVGKIYSLLKTSTGQTLNRQKPLVVIFYPGKDENNSGGQNDRISIRIRKKELCKGLQEVAGVEPIYIYKDNTGLEKQKNFITWHKDPEAFFEKNFFKHHYPGSSFVVISDKGEYISYYGEFPNEFVWDAAQKLSSN
ncbi:hypothetical protein [uncultured Draconibacterium sp.]|uniref:hypothetical protein n=1 Tax=uncultured Draconibacterium sp. TaxID=1573823 RepID=UPI0032165C23